MKKITLRTALIAAALLCGANAWAQITSLPYSADFSESIAPFSKVGDAGTVEVTTLTNSTEKVLKIGAATAVATFGDDGYALKDNEEVTISFTAFNGWYSNSKTTVVSVNLANGTELASYTYDIKECEITNVKIGGVTPDGFSSFAAGSRYNTASNKSGANGFTGSSQYYVATDGYNPVITFKVTKSGMVTFRCVKSYDSINKEYTASLSEAQKEGGIVLQNIKIVNNAIEDRGMGMDNLSVTSLINETPQYAYQVRYVDENGSEISSRSDGEAEAGFVCPVSEAAKWVGNVKYIYVSNDAAENPVSADGANLITVTYRRAATYTYSVQTSLGTLLASDSNYEGETINVPFSEYELSGTTLYRTNEGTAAGSHVKSFTLAGDAVVTINYEEAADNVVFFSEGEDIAGVLTAGSTSNASMSLVAATNGNGGDQGAIEITTLAPGSYKITAKHVGHTNAGRNERTYDFTTEGNDKVYSFSTTNTVATGTSDEFVVSKNTKIRFAGGWATTNTGNAYGLDLVYIQKTADYTESVEISSLGYSTYSSVNALDFTGIDGLKAYIASENKDGEITFTPVTTVAAGQGLLLAGEAGKSYNVKAIAEADAPETNYLVAATENIEALASEAADGKLNYILNNVDGNTGFYAANGKKVAAGKAYLQLPAAAAAKAFIPFNFGLANAIEAVSTVAQSADSRIYNLSGQRLSSLQKGLNIVNGKKIYVK